MYRNADRSAAGASGPPIVRSSDAALLTLVRLKRGEHLACWSVDAHAKAAAVLAMATFTDTRVTAIGDSMAEMAGAVAASAATADERHLAVEHV